MNFNIDDLLNSPEMPWAVGIALLLVLIIFLLWKLRQSRNRETQKSTQLEILGRDMVALAERLKAKEQELIKAEQTYDRQITTLSEQRDRVQQSFQHESQRHSEFRNEAAANESSLKERINAATEKLQLLENAEKRLQSSFENLANRIFEEKHEKFNEASKLGVEALLTPMRQQLGDFRKRVDEVYDKENEQRTTLRAEITQLKNLNERISTDALNLTNALKGDSKVRGNWGEVQLELLLEESGLKKGREYDVQTSHKNEEGKRYQPDAIVHLPDNKDVIIDSKVSLVAYEAYHSSETEGDRERCLKEHLTSIRTHIRQLSGKSYDELVGLRSLDLVIMFVPIEPALLLALEHEPGLYNEAYHKGIVLVSPTLLMATLQIINNIWRYEHQNRHALTIAEEAGKMYDQFVGFVESLDKVGDHIRKAGESYDVAKKRLIDGRGNLVGRTQKLKDLGAKAKKTISKELLDEGAIQTIEDLAGDDMLSDHKSE